LQHSWTICVLKLWTWILECFLSLGYVINLFQQLGVNFNSSVCISYVPFSFQICTCNFHPVVFWLPGYHQIFEISLFFFFLLLVCYLSLQKAFFFWLLIYSLFSNFWSVYRAALIQEQCLRKIKNWITNDFVRLILFWEKVKHDHPNEREGDETSAEKSGANPPSCRTKFCICEALLFVKLN